MFMNQPGQKLTLGTIRLGMMPETESKPMKRKINKKTTLFDLLPPDFILMIKKVHDRLVHKFFLFVKQITSDTNPLLHLGLNNNWDFFGT